MTPSERLAAAIEKLGALKAAASPGPWEAVKGYDSEHFPVHLYHARRRPTDPDYDRDIIDSAGFAEDYSGPRANDAALIVTLHATIDAQLALLTNARARALSKIEHGGIDRAVWSHEVDALTLADAILGSQS